MSSGDLVGLSGKHVRSVTVIGGETEDDKEGSGGGGAGVPAHGWNFWESAPVNTRGCATPKTQAYRVPAPLLVSCSRFVHMDPS